MSDASCSGGANTVGKSLAVCWLVAVWRFTYLQRNERRLVVACTRPTKLHQLTISFTRGFLRCHSHRIAHCDRRACANVEHRGRLIAHSCWCHRATQGLVSFGSKSEF